MEKYVKVPIFPVTQFLTVEERKRKNSPAPMEPVSFLFGEDEIQVDKVRSCVRGVSRKVGGRGFRYDCRVSWCNDDLRTKESSIVWYDDFLQEWFVEVRESRAPPDWHTAIQIGDIGDYYDE